MMNSLEYINIFNKKNSRDYVVNKLVNQLSSADKNHFYAPVSCNSFFV